MTTDSRTRARDRDDYERGYMEGKAACRETDVEERWDGPTADMTAAMTARERDGFEAGWNDFLMTEAED